MTAEIISVPSLQLHIRWTDATEQYSDYEPVLGISKKDLTNAVIQTLYFQSSP